MIRLTLSELADSCGATLEGDGARTVSGPAPLADARAEHVSFLAHPRYRDQLATTGAGAVLVPRDLEVERDGLALLRCEDPGRSFTQVIVAFTRPDPDPPHGVHPSATVGQGVELGEGVSIGPSAVVGDGTVLGSGVVVGPNVVVGEEARVGAHTVLRPGVVLYPRVTLGERCLVHAGAVLGSDGFGFDPTPEGWAKIPQCGTVVVEDDVEIGANVTIDRARFGATRIGRGAKIDNLVHVGHNVVVGEASLLVAQSGVAGSTRLGRRAILAGQAGVSGHLEIGDGARVGGGSAVFRDVPAGVDVFGVPAGPKAESLRIQAWQRKLGGLLDRVRAMEARIAELEGRP